MNSLSEEKKNTSQIRKVFEQYSKLSRRRNETNCNVFGKDRQYLQKLYTDGKQNTTRRRMRMKYPELQLYALSRIALNDSHFKIYVNGRNVILAEVIV